MSLSKAYTDYQMFTKSTAVYPREFTQVLLSSTASIYLALGLADEAGELCEKISQFTERARLLPADGEPRKVTRKDILAEMGDVSWYAVRLIDESGRDLAAIMEMGPKYEGVATLDGIALFIASRAGYVAGRTKKRIRDAAKMTIEQWAENETTQFIAIGDILGALMTMCRFFSVNFHEVLGMNQSKLSSRKDRGVLQGDGDNR